MGEEKKDAAIRKRYFYNQDIQMVSNTLIVRFIYSYANFMWYSG